MTMGGLNSQSGRDGLNSRPQCTHMQQTTGDVHGIYMYYLQLFDSCYNYM